MMDYWTNFARYGDPNKGSNVPLWPAFTQKNMTNPIFQTPTTKFETNWNKKDCDFFDHIGYHHGWKSVRG